MGERYEVWDVTTDKGRWRVVTNPTNLYSQAHFQSLDYTLSFHIGLMMRVQSRQVRSGSPNPFEEVFRRQEQAADRFNRAVEAEDYQAVGMQLRESLLSLISAARRRVEVEDATGLLKAADFVGWSNFLVESLCGGSSNKSLRQYLKSTAERTWQLVQSLTHDRDALRPSAFIALEACNTLVGHWVQLLIRRESDNLETCPNCASRNLRSHFDPSLGTDGRYYMTCGACGWSNHSRA
jgi:hypothetical protein